MTRTLITDLCALRVRYLNEKRNKAKKKDAIEEVASLESVVRTRAQMYCAQYGLWVTADALQVSIRPSPRIDVWSLDRFDDDDTIASAEVEQVFLSFTTHPQDLQEPRAEELKVVVGRSAWFASKVRHLISVNLEIVYSLIS